MQWEFDPETPRAGCDVYNDWSYSQYGKDTRRDDLYEQGGFLFSVSVRHGDDPIEIARDATNLQQPDFGESDEELRIEGWVSIGFGLVLLAAPSFQVCQMIGQRASPRLSCLFLGCYVLRSACPFACFARLPAFMCAPPV